MELLLPVRFRFYEHRILLNEDGEELGEQHTVGGRQADPLPTPDINGLRSSFLSLATPAELSQWLEEARYVPLIGGKARERWELSFITEELQQRFFALRDILKAWLLTPDAISALLKRFPGELVDEVCGTTGSTRRAEVPVRGSIVEEPTGTYISLPILGPRTGLILSAHIDLFWRTHKFRPCDRCGAPFVVNREIQRFCSPECKHRAASARSYKKSVRRH